MPMIRLSSNLTIAARMRHKYDRMVLLRYMTPRSAEAPVQPDALDLEILRALMHDASLQPTDLARAVNVDRRTLTKRLERMKKSGLLRVRVDVDWSLLGVGISAYLGSTTALGEEDVAKLYDFIRHEPRVVEAYSTVGSNEYFLKILDVNLQTFREEVLRRLEPLTADLSTSIISSKMKSADYLGFLDYLEKRARPGGRQKTHR